MVLAGGLRQCRSQYDFWYFSGYGKHQRQAFWAFLPQEPSFVVSSVLQPASSETYRSDRAQGRTARAAAAAAALEVAAL